MAKISAQDIAVANLGGVYINDTTEKTGRYRALYVSSETIFDHLKINGSNDDSKSNFITTAGTSVDAGVLITASPGNYFSSVKLTSGKVYAINEYSA